MVELDIGWVVLGSKGLLGYTVIRLISLHSRASPYASSNSKFLCSFSSRSYHSAILLMSKSAALSYNHDRQCGTGIIAKGLSTTR